MGDGSAKSLARLENKFIRRLLLVHLHIEGERLDEHPHRAGQAALVSAVMGGIGDDLLFSDEFCKRVFVGGEEEAALRSPAAADGCSHVRGGDAQFALERRGGLVHFLRPALVADDLGGEFRAVEEGLEVHAALGTVRGRLGKFLRFGREKERVRFAERLFPAVGARNVLAENSERGSVEYEMMKVEEEVPLFSARAKRGAVKSRLAQIEGTDEAIGGFTY